jgi:hypothetical protein
MPFSGAPLDEPCVLCDGIAEYLGDGVEGGLPVLVYRCEECGSTTSHAVISEPAAAPRLLKSKRGVNL